MGIHVNRIDAWKGRVIATEKSLKIKKNDIVRVYVGDNLILLLH